MPILLSLMLLVSVGSPGSETAHPRPCDVVTCTASTDGASRPVCSSKAGTWTCDVSPSRRRAAVHLAVEGDEFLAWGAVHDGSTDVQWCCEVGANELEEVVLVAGARGIDLSPHLPATIAVPGSCRAGCVSPDTMVSVGSVDIIVGSTGVEHPPGVRALPLTVVGIEAF